MTKVWDRFRGWFRELLTFPIGELLGGLVLVLVALGGIFIAAFDILGHPIHIFKGAAEVTLVLLGLLGLHFALERFSVLHRIEKSVSFVELVGVEIPQRLKALLEDVVKSLAQLEKLKGRRTKGNLQFFAVADKTIDEMKFRLQELSEGKLNTPRDRKLIIHQMMLNHYSRRFDTISDNDLNYWINPDSDAERYLKIATASIQSAGTVVTRIFIFPRTDFKDRSAQIADVLCRQNRCGIGWAVAIRDLLPNTLTQDAWLDFGLYDEGQAVSLFRKMEGDMRYETTFAVANNIKDIGVHKSTYRQLVGECWLANEQFVANYGRMFSQKSLSVMTRRATNRNENVKRALGRQVNKHQIFLLVASAPEQIHGKVATLEEILKEYSANVG